MEVTPLQRFKRFLHLATEENVHQPGCKFFFKHYCVEKVASFGELMQGEDRLIIVDTIKQVHLDKTSPFPEALIFALSLCCKQNKDVVLRKTAFELAETICASTEDFFLFFKFAFESPPKISTGSICKKFIQKWYFKRTPLELAAVVSDVKRYRSWEHKDIIRIGHLFTKDPAKAASVKYAMRGLEEMKKEFDKNPEAEEVIKHLEVVEGFRKNTNSFEVSRLIEEYMLSLTHIHYSLYHNKEVWAALLRLVPMKTLLDHFHILSENRFFREGLTYDFHFIQLVADALGKQSSITESGLHPSRAFIEHLRLENEAKVKIDLASKLRNTPVKKPPGVHRLLVTAFEKLTLDLFKNVKPTNKRYLVGIQTSEDITNKCWHCRYISVGTAIAFIAFCLMKKEENVTFLYHNETNGELERLAITKDMFYRDIRCLIDETSKKSKGTVKVEQMLKWAAKTNTKFDVCVSLAANIKRTEDKNKIKKFKLIMCNLGCRAKVNTIDSPNCLSLYGFDDKMCTLISSFARGAF